MWSLIPIWIWNICDISYRHLVHSLNFHRVLRFVINTIYYYEKKDLCWIPCLEKIRGHVISRMIGRFLLMNELISVMTLMNFIFFIIIWLQITIFSRFVYNLSGVFYLFLLCTKTWTGTRRTAVDLCSLRSTVSLSAVCSSNLLSIENGR